MNNVLNNQPTLANLIWENFSHEFRQFIYTQYRTLSFIGHIINLLTFFVLFIAKCFHMKTTKYASILHQCCTQFSRNLPVSARRQCRVKRTQTSLQLSLFRLTQEFFPRNSTSFTTTIIPHFIKVIAFFYRQFSVQLFMQEAGILELLFQTQDLDTRLKLLHQVAEFVPDTQMHVSNWRFLSRIFSGKFRFQLYLLLTTFMKCFSYYLKSDPI